MNCEEILEDVIAFCKKEIEELEDKTNVEDPSGYDSRNTRRGLRDAYENVIERIAIKRAVEKCSSESIIVNRRLWQLIVPSSSRSDLFQR